MIAPWTLEAVLEAHARRPEDRRIRQALCIDEPDCSGCSMRWSVSDCPECGLDIPPFRNVFRVRPRSIFDRLPELCP